MTDTTNHRKLELPRLLSIPELAEHLGVNIRHIRRLVHERRVPFLKVGHLIRFDPAEITTWLDTLRRHPGAPVDYHPTPVRPAPVQSTPRRRSAQTAPLGRDRSSASDPQLELPEVS